MTMNIEKTRQCLNDWQPQMISIFRIVVGLLFLQHGLQKWFGVPVPMANNQTVQLMTMVGVAGVIEIVTGALVAVGLFTRYAALIASGEMAVAYFFYANRLSRGVTPLANGGNMEVLYCFAFLLLVFIGAGAWSLDARLRGKS
jgi:putative oxidoreductase